MGLPRGDARGGGMRATVTIMDASVAAVALTDTAAVTTAAAFAAVTDVTSVTAPDFMRLRLLLQ